MQKNDFAMRIKEFGKKTSMCKLESRHAKRYEQSEQTEPQQSKTSFWQD